MLKLNQRGEEHPLVRSTRCWLAPIAATSDPIAAYVPGWSKPAASSMASKEIPTAAPNKHAPIVFAAHRSGGIPRRLIHTDWTAAVPATTMV
jgi:hypothetical protein